jgi:hypothetical protein
MKYCRFLIILIFLSSCYKPRLISSCEIQRKMRIDSEIERLETRDRKIFLGLLWLGYGILMTRLTDTWR